MKDDLDHWAIDNGLMQLINETTWRRIITWNGEKTERESTLDLIFTNDDHAQTWVLDNMTSDHNLILVRSSVKSTEVLRQKIVRRDWRRYHPLSLNEKLSLGSMPILDDKDLLIDEITTMLQKAYNELCPTKVIRTNRTDAVIDQNLEQMKKKRKRLRKAFNKPTCTKKRKDKLARKIENLNKSIKARITSTRKEQLRTKMDGKNPKSFWHCVSNLEGKKKLSAITLTESGITYSKDADVAELFADFFNSKVADLSNNYGQLDYRVGPSNLSFTDVEILKAAKMLKPKLCSGEDELPMRLVKDFAILCPGMLAYYFTNFCKVGLPNRWKTAVITPLHKSGDKQSVKQYRPISNLDSLSKLFEKVLLNRLENLGEMDGKHQHGFKKDRSTTTAMLEIQDFVASNLDSGKVVGTYSLDLSAAFDLLRPDVLYQTLESSLPSELLNPIMDFLSERNFQVQIGSTRSSKKELKVGCVQGSILGPRLFTLYMKNLPAVLGNDANINITAYADDTYISIADSLMLEVKRKLEKIMEIHDDYLLSIGMRTNVSKTELIYFSRKPLLDAPSILVKGTEIRPSTTMKILGLKFQNNLAWDTQFDSLKKKARLTFAKIRYLSKLIDLDGMKKSSQSISLEWHIMLANYG